MKRQQLPLYLIALLLFITVGCGEQETVVKDKQPEPPQTEKQPKRANQEEEFKAYFPLNGTGTNQEINQRPISVMINNHPKARPQSGLSKADLVYEVLAEGYITRFLAIYQNEIPDIIGPIRSSRDYYIDLSQGYDTIYVAYGGSTSALNKLDAGATDYLNGIKFKNGRNSFEDDRFYDRADFRTAPHNVYMQKKNLFAGIEAHGYDQTSEIEPLLFIKNPAETETLSATATEIKITYSESYNSSVRYVYDKQTKSYLRYNGEEQSVDRETNEPIMINNLLIVEAPHEVIDDAGRRAINFQTGGTAYLFQNGSFEQVNWQNVKGRILPVKDGKVLPFIPGQTWINVVPEKPGIEQAVQMRAE